MKSGTRHTLEGIPLVKGGGRNVGNMGHTRVTMCNLLPCGFLTATFFAHFRTNRYQHSLNEGRRQKRQRERESELCVPIATMAGRMSPVGRREKGFYSMAFRSVGLIVFYWIWSIGLTFYQKEFVSDFRIPLTSVTVHLMVKFLLAGLWRSVEACCFMPRNSRIAANRCPAIGETITKVGLPAGAAALDIGLSNWSLEFITVSLYAMGKSTTIVFILIFSIALALEKFVSFFVRSTNFCYRFYLDFIFSFTETNADAIGVFNCIGSILLHLSC